MFTIEENLFYFVYLILFPSEVNLRRHISCESCLEKVNGGFDPSTNQVTEKIHIRVKILSVLSLNIFAFTLILIF